MIERTKFSYQEMLEKRKKYEENIKALKDRDFKKIELKFGSYYGIPKEEWEKEFIPKILNEEKFIFLYTDKIMQRVANPVMVVDETGWRGNSEVERLVSVIFKCLNCESKIQIINSIMFIGYDSGEDKYFLEVREKFGCTDCKMTLQLKKSQLKEVQ